MSTLSAPESTRTLIDELLAEQQKLTAVERFAQRHGGPARSQSRYYQDLIPLNRPRPGEQYAFRVDLDACTGCKACVSACHSLNGLDEDETWRSVGLLHGGSTMEPYQQTVTTACHHCVDPACLNGCPVLAYEKDEVTGIVRHLDDQCIGCQYCVLKCPYDVPKYSSKRGIVRKCDMCHSRLAVGEAPACVQACPSGAISVGLVSRAETARACDASGEQLLPGVFASNYTKPTTVYSSRKSFPANCRPADAGAPRLETAHWPLVWMLVLTQAAAGLSLAASLTISQGQVFEAGKLPLAASGLTLLLAGLAASVFHLGRPLGAWRALLGLRRSWMSREILMFGLFAAAAAGFVVASLLGRGATAANLAIITASFALASVCCSAMVYVDTRRPVWRWQQTFPEFFGTTLLLGVTGAATIFAWVSFFQDAELMGKSVQATAWAALIVRTVLFLWERRRKPIGTLAPAGIALFFMSTAFGLTAMYAIGLASASLATLSFLSTFGSQIIRRYCFFVTAAAPKMPGSFSE